MIWRTFEMLSARVIDAAMCGMMFGIQRRHRLAPGSREALALYVKKCAGLSRGDYYPLMPAQMEVGNVAGIRSVAWTSPVRSGYPENDRAFALHFPAPGGSAAPTAIFLHALMSTSDRGYRRWASLFNSVGWGACFVHLPYHYSRIPKGYRNGEFSITADLVRTAEALRQSVMELRQLMAWLRTEGVGEFGLWACSYGGWVGALLASVEADFRFIALIEPIVDVGHAIWHSPTGAALRRELRRHGIEPEIPAGHFPLVSPMHAQPLCGGERVILAAGEYDTIARARDIARLQSLWAGSTLLTEPQGHFGHRLMPATWQWLNARGWLQSKSGEAS